MAVRLSAYFLLLGFLVGNLYRPSLINPDIKISFLDLGVTILYLVAFYKSRLKLFHQLFSFQPLLLYTVWLIISLAVGAVNLPPNLGFSGLAYLLRYIIYLYSYYPLKIIFSRHQLSALVTALSLVFPLMGALQYLWFPDLRPFTVFGWDMHYYRVFGNFLDPGYFGLILLWCLLNIKQWHFWVISYLVFAFTYSRSCFLAFLGSFSYLFYRYRHNIGIILIFGLFISTLFFLPRGIKSEGVRLERTSSVVSRFGNWQDSLDIFFRYPLFGVGFNLLRFQYQNQPLWEVSHAASGSDSSLLFILTTTGVVGLALYLNLIYHLWLIIRRTPTVSAFFIAIFIHSFFLNSQFYVPIILLMSLSIALKVDN